MGVDHDPLQDFTMDLVLTLCIWLQKAWRFSYSESTSPHPVPSPVRHHDTHYYSTADGRAETDRLDWLARTPLVHHFDSVWGQGSAQWYRPHLELDDNRKNMIIFGDATESY